VLIIGSLFIYKWEQSNDSGALDSFGQFALVMGADPTSFPRHNFAVRRSESLDQVDIFVVNVIHVVGAEEAKAIFLPGSNEGSFLIIHSFMV
jgi:hypothetical protein